LQRCIDIAAASATRSKPVEVYLRDGTYRVTRFSTLSYCLLLKTGVHIVGESQAGVIIKQAASIASAVRLFYTTSAAGCRLANLTLDGNKSTQTVNEHRHGMFIDGAVDLVVENVTAQNFTGDGLYVYLDTTGLRVRNCTGIDNDRNGFTLGRTCSGVWVTNNTFKGNAAQQLDSEPATTDLVEDIHILGNVLGDPDGSDAGNYVLTVSGTSSDGKTRDWDVRGNECNGPVFIVWADDIEFRSNNVTMLGGTSPALTVYRNCDDIRIRHNTITVDRPLDSAAEQSAVRVDATGVGNQPDNVLLEHNAISLLQPNVGGPTAAVIVRGALHFTAEHNTVTGCGANHGAGYDGAFLLRANVASTEWNVRRNIIRNTGTVGVKLYDTLAVGAVDISYNDIDDTQGTPTMVLGVDLIDGSSGPAVGSFTCVDNQIGTAIATPIDYPPSGYVLTSYTPEGFPVYRGEIAPGGVVAAVAGSIYIRVSTAGVVTATYEKPAAGATTWTLVA
jgi:hypothetical protein